MECHPVFKPTRTHALAVLASFIERVPQYAARRNFVTTSLEEVSLLSPYLRLRLISEDEVIAAVLQRHSLRTAEKFIQEVCWRSYWRNWLELHPAVWQRYREFLRAQTYPIHSPTAQARAGQTEIPSFNAWIQALKGGGYLHNHLRMYFASIWVHTLKLPWQDGAALFMEHLLDGDPASNTLSWRWVAGLHTRGKSYLATVDNISFHTGTVFDAGGVRLATTAAVMDQSPVAVIEPVVPSETVSYSESRHCIIVSDEELCVETIVPRNALARCAVLFVPTRSDASQAVQQFRAQALQDAIARLQGSGATVRTYSSAEDLSHATEAAEVVVYLPGIGPAREAVGSVLNALPSLGVSPRITRHPWDLAAQFERATGFFPYWDRMKKIIERRYAGSVA
ncbi:MAG: hypothetical protein EBZ48_03325 [Proteobacteria bacterium]|nr:hypothetical protein [Pseudomonadota bacterium]